MKETDGRINLKDQVWIKDRRAKHGKRRQRQDMPNAPFKDSMGATISECRRKNPDRRVSSI